MKWMKLAQTLNSLVSSETRFDDARDRFPTMRQRLSPSFSVYHYNGLGKKMILSVLLWVKRTMRKQGVKRKII